ncbi:MAG: TIGR03619 family F420-dependent LLM class oxidoreductase [Candidatus Hodarchaeales archaeon]|jgi:probable F420-dependent oxidoreductase
MKFGYEIENFDTYLDPDTIIQTAKELERANFHSIWTVDHILQPIKSPLPLYNTIAEVITTLAFIAGHTKSIKLGVATLVLPLRNPIVVAKQLATLDYLTKGRLVISFGAGWNKGEYEILNQNFHNRGKRFNEALRLIRALWQGETSFAGKYFNFEEASFKPLRKELADLPILIAGNSDHAIQRAIKYGDGWFPSCAPTTMREKLSKFKKELNRRNFDRWLWYAVKPRDKIDQIVTKCEKNKLTGLVFDLTRGGLTDRESVFEELTDFVKNY